MLRDTEGEPFELLNQLGRGGFATAYRARVIDPELREEFGEIVALKVPHGRREAKALKSELELNAGLHMRLRKITSPNLVRYLGFELFQGRIVMVMEYVPEGSLRTRLAGNRRMAPADAALIAQGILRGLALIHREEIVHRDIKPENILMDGDTPKIADFGIARLLDAGQLALSQAGTIPYMSPEILSAHGGSSRSDLWSTGVTLYEMLTGRWPFGESTTPIAQIVRMICDSEPVPVGDLCPTVPPAVAEVIRRALDKDPGNRYATAEDMCGALEAPADEPLERELRALREMLDDPSQADLLESRLNKVIAAHPGDWRAFQHLAELLSRRQRPQEAARLLRAAIKVAPANGMLHWRLALTLQRIGSKPEALAAVRQALDVGIPDNLREHAARLITSLGGTR